MNSFKEFKLLWEDEWHRHWFSHHNKNKFPHLIFIVVYPDKLKWDFGVEKQTQTTCLQISGGMTGAGTGHNVKLLYQSELYEFLKTCTQTHAMIVTVGMVFEMTVPSTAINKFHEFSKSKRFCKAHIIAKPNQSAWLDPQHIELNIEKWKKLDCPDLSRKKMWTEYRRAEQNYHDDYTPFWLKPKGIPRIHNFSVEERRNKAFGYGHMKDRRLLQNETWEKLRLGKFDEVDHEVQGRGLLVHGVRHRGAPAGGGHRGDNYFSRLMTRMKSTYYLTNMEDDMSRPMQDGHSDKAYAGRMNRLEFLENEIDIIMVPTGGYTGELISNANNCNGEVIFYDYTQENVNIKKAIVEMNMSKSELQYYITKVKPNTNFNVGKLWESIDSYKEQQQKMSENCDIDYWVMNLIEPDYDKLLKKVKGKRVYFNASNIFSYHISHAMYTLDELIVSYNRLHEILSNAESYHFRGSAPGKVWEYR